MILSFIGASHRTITSSQLRRVLSLTNEMQQGTSIYSPIQYEIKYLRPETTVEELLEFFNFFIFSLLHLEPELLFAETELCKLYEKLFCASMPK